MRPITLLTNQSLILKKRKKLHVFGLFNEVAVDKVVPVTSCVNAVLIIKELHLFLDHKAGTGFFSHPLACLKVVPKRDEMV